LNSITEFEWKIENKNILQKQKHSMNQEQHLALEMPASRTAHVERERESTPAKQHQGIAWATKAQ
jgi:hypothetical protein